MDGYETTADLNEAIYYERLDMDIEMAELEAESRRISALHRRGICTHGAGLGYLAEAVYSADDIAAMLAKGRHGNRGGFTGDQAAIGAGNILCTDCGEVHADRWADR